MRDEGKYIAICSDIFVFQANRMFDNEWAKRSPGSAWTCLFVNMARERGYTVVTGDIALSHVQAGYWEARDVLVMQELKAGVGEELVKRGARPWIITGFEGPLVAYRFYDRLAEIASKFEHRVLFPEYFKDVAQETKGQNHPLFVPAFDEKELKAVVPWKDRQFLVLVASNKHCHSPARFHPHPLKCLRNLGRYFLRRPWT